MIRRKTFMRRLAFALLMSAVLPLSNLNAQSFENELKTEAGFWMGGAFPVPGTKADDVLDSTLGAGGFFRFYWPNPFLLELGFSYANYRSEGTQQLITVPTYAALVYPIPYFQRFSVMVKLGAGASYLEVRPVNKSGWDPMMYGGFEFSILAARRFRVGLRIDGYYIYEQFRSEPKELQYLKFMQGSFDDRFYQTKDFRIYNPAFYNFGLMVSFIL
jgi:hypothetical protein